MTAGEHRRTLKRRALAVMLGQHRQAVATQIAAEIERSAAPADGHGHGCACPPCTRHEQAGQDAAAALRVGAWPG